MGTPGRPYATLSFDPQADLYAVAGNMARSFRPFPARLGRHGFPLVQDEGSAIVDRTVLSI